MQTDSVKSFCLITDKSYYIGHAQIGVGLMMFQRFGGASGVGFYASETFTSAGYKISELVLTGFLPLNLNKS